MLKKPAAAMSISLANVQAKKMPKRRSSSKSAEVTPQLAAAAGMPSTTPSPIVDPGRPVRARRKRGKAAAADDAIDGDQTPTSGPLPSPRAQYAQGSASPRDLSPACSQKSGHSQRSGRSSQASRASADPKEVCTAGKIQEAAKRAGLSMADVMAAGESVHPSDQDGDASEHAAGAGNPCMQLKTIVETSSQYI